MPQCRDNKTAPHVLAFPDSDAITTFNDSLEHLVKLMGKVRTDPEGSLEGMEGWQPGALGLILPIEYHGGSP